MLISLYPFYQLNI